MDNLPWKGLWSEQSTHVLMEAIYHYDPNYCIQQMLYIYYGINTKTKAIWLRIIQCVINECAQKQKMVCEYRVNTRIETSTLASFLWKVILDKFESPHGAPNFYNKFLKECRPTNLHSWYLSQSSFTVTIFWEEMSMVTMSPILTAGGVKCLRKIVSMFGVDRSGCWSVLLVDSIATWR